MGAAEQDLRATHPRQQHGEKCSSFAPQVLALRLEAATSESRLW